MVDLESLGVYMEAQRECAESNHDRVEDLLALIRHEFHRTHQREEGCASCRRFTNLALSRDVWPWRDYPGDEPLAGDLP
jgi:hypothetical protein